MIENNREVKHFTDLKVWQKAHRLFLDFIKDINDIRDSIATREVIKQMVRSIGSISANISEGFDAHTTKEYIRYLDISKRTTGESENWFYKLRDAGFITKDKATERINTCTEISKMLYGLMLSLSRKLKNGKGV